MHFVLAQRATLFVVLLMVPLGCETSDEQKALAPDGGALDMVMTDASGDVGIEDASPNPEDGGDSDGSPGDAAVDFDFPPNSVAPDDPVPTDGENDPNCASGCLLATGQCAGPDDIFEGYCGAPGSACQLSCDACDGRYDSMGFPEVHDGDPSACVDCPSMAEFCDQDNDGEVDAERAGVGVTLCSSDPSGMPCFNSTPVSCDCTCCPSCQPASVDGVELNLCEDMNGGEPSTCELNTPQVGLVAWIEPLPISGPQYDALRIDLLDDYCQSLLDFELGDCTTMSQAELAVIGVKIDVALRSLALTANPNVPPDQMLGVPWADFVRSKQYRSITQVGGMTVQCHEGRILNTLGQDTKYDNHGYTPLPGGENPVRFEPGAGQVYHLFPEGRGPGRDCLFVDHRHVFLISGPGGAIADLLSNPFDIPLAFHRIQYRVCCPAAGEEIGQFTVHLESSNFPSAKAYIEGQRVSTRLQEGLGEFMFSNPDDRARFPPSGVLTERTQDVDCEQ